MGHHQERIDHATWIMDRQAHPPLLLPHVLARQERAKAAAEGNDNSGRDLALAAGAKRTLSRAPHRSYGGGRGEATKQ
jgi:hypothetical protein